MDVSGFKAELSVKVKQFYGLYKVETSQSAEV